MLPWSEVASRPPQRSPGRATPCCWPRGAPPWTCSPTTPHAGDAFAAAVQRRRRLTGPTAQRGARRDDDREPRRPAPAASATPAPGPGGTPGPPRCASALDRPLTSYYLLLGASALLLTVGLIMVLCASSVYAFEHNDGDSYAVVKQAADLGGASACRCAWVAARLPPALDPPAGLARARRLAGAAAAHRRPRRARVNGNKNWLALGPVRDPALRARQAGAGAVGRRRLRPQGAPARQPGRTCWCRSCPACCGPSRWCSSATTSAPRWSCSRSCSACSGSSVRRPRLFVCRISVVAACAAIVLAATNPERLPRITDFADPVKRLHGTGWQAAHGIFALASGGWCGAGLGASQQKWGNLPEAHTDFIFAVLGEELGLVGTLLVLALFGAIGYAAHPGRARRPRTRSSATRPSASWSGCSAQAMINIGMVLGLLPITGVPLPLVSYGGSALRARRWSRSACCSPSPAASPRPPGPSRRRRRPSTRRLRRSRHRRAEAEARSGCASSSPAGVPPATSPLLATADALRRLDPDVEITCLGTARGLETAAGPGGRLRARADPAGADARGAPTPTCSGVPGAAARRGARRRSTCSTGCGPTWSSASAATSRCRPTSPPARRGVPLVVHESNALPGLANKLGARLTPHVATTFPRHPLPHADVRRAADPPDDRRPSTGAALPRRGAGLLRPRPRPADPAGHRRLAGRAPAQRGGAPAPRRRCADAGVQVLHVVGPKQRGATGARTGVPPTSSLPLRRPDGPRLRRRRPGALPGRGQHRHRGGRASGCRRSSCRCRSATASRRSTPGRSSTPAAALLVDDADLHARVGRRPPSPLLTDPDAARRMGAAAAGADPARRRREAGPDRRCERGGSADEDPGPRRASCPADRAGPGALRRHRRRRAVRHRPDHAGPRHRRSAAATARTRRPCGAARARRHRCTSATTPTTSATPTPWSSPPRSARTTPSTSRPARRGLRVLPRSAALAVGDGRPPGRRRRRHPRQDHHHLVLTVALQRCGADPSYASAATSPRPGATPTTAPATCSSPRPTRATARSCVYSPHAAIVTNVEADHLDNWGTEEAYQRPSTTSSDRIDRDGLPGRAASTTPAPPTSPAPPASRGLDVVASARASDGATCAPIDLRFDGTHLDVRRPRRRRGARRGDACRSRAATTSSTRWPRSRSGCGSGYAVRRPARGPRRLHRHPAGGWSARARPAGCGSTTATPTTRSRSPATSQAARARGRRRPAGRGLPAAPGLAHPDLRRPRWARRSAPPTRSWCSTSTSPARTPTPRSPARWSPTPCRCRRSRCAFVPDLDAVAGRAGRPGPSRRPGAHPRRRQRHRARARGCSSLLRWRRVRSTRSPRDPPRDATTRRRAAVTQPARFARRQWARRWLAWRSVLVLGAAGRAGRRRGLAGVLLLACSPSRTSRSPGPSTSWPSTPIRAAAAVPTGEPLARRRPRRDPSAGSRRSPSVAVGRRDPRSGPTPC